MFTRISRSWRIFKNSLAVLSQNKKLVIFPILSTTFLVAIALIIFGSAASFFMLNENAGMHLQNLTERRQVKTHAVSTASASQTEAEADNQETITEKAGGIAVLFVAYFISIFLATFFNVAFFSEIFHGLQGEPVFIARGFKFALSKAGSIAMWALLAASVGTLLKLLEERLGWLGQIVVRLIGLAWNIVTIFAVPVIICEEDSKNPLKNLKRSAGIIKETWGESLVGFLGISAISTLLLLPIILTAAVLGIVAVFLQNFWALGAVIVIAIVSIAIISMLLGIAQKIYIASLYLYATEGFLNDAYDQELMQAPFKTKK
jgi:hypothetical protein